jgi:hypothetical protein
MVAVGWHVVGAGDGNRTRMTSLEGWDSAIELRPRTDRGYSRCSAPERPRRRSVGEGGFEPPTSCSQSRCAARLRYSPDYFGPDLGIRRSGPKCSSSTALGPHIIRDGSMEEWNIERVGDLERLRRSFERHLRAENKSAKTVGDPRRVGDPDAGVSGGVGHRVGSGDPATAAGGLRGVPPPGPVGRATAWVRGRALQQIFRWLVDSHLSLGTDLEVAHGSCTTQGTPSSAQGPVQR